MVVGLPAFALYLFLPSMSMIALRALASLSALETWAGLRPETILSASVFATPRATILETRWSCSLLLGMISPGVLLLLWLKSVGFDPGAGHHLPEAPPPRDLPPVRLLVAIPTPMMTRMMSRARPEPRSEPPRSHQMK